MKRLHSIARCGFVLTLLVAASLLQVQSQAQGSRPHRIAVFGSSVANGTGDEFGKEGYTGMLREMFAPRGWEVVNQSRGGDTTITMAPRFAPQGAPDPKVRYLLPANPGYVVIGLSLANEGIFEATTKQEKDAVFKQYAEGIKGFVDRSREHNIVPVVALVYPRMVYTPVEYEYVRRMNVLQSSGDAPTVNFLGALDDGTGRYANGFDFDDKHPNAAGHREFLYAFVPTLFEALDKGKPDPAKSKSPSFARVSGGSAPLTFTPQDTMHAFAFAITVRAQGDGTVAAIDGHVLTAATETKRLDRGAGRSVEFQSTSLSAGKPFTATVGIQRGAWTYKPAGGNPIVSSVNADGLWHQLVVSHYMARGETLFFVDGKLAGRTAERLEPSRFVIGGAGGAEAAPSPKQADFKDLLLYRAGLNGDEVAALHQGTLLKASLEVYSPLADARFDPGSPVENRAQSMTSVKTESRTVVHMDNDPLVSDRRP